LIADAQIQYNMTKAALKNLAFTVKSSLNLMILNRSGNIKGSGSGVLISYRQKYFICTVEHNVKKNKNRIAILTGHRQGDTEITVQPPELSFLENLNVTELTAAGLRKALDNPQDANTLDIAFASVQKLDNLIQEKVSLHLRDGSTLEIPKGKKNIIEIKDILTIRKNAKYSFSGRIKTRLNAENIFFYAPQLVFGMKLISMGQDMIKFDLGYPIADNANFKGCSGAPIFDDKGQLVALVAWGDKDISKSYIYAFRLDRMIDFIKMMYFFPALEEAITSRPKNK